MMALDSEAGQALLFRALFVAENSHSKALNAE
jgi:hypothetical protein